MQRLSPILPYADKTALSLVSEIVQESNFSDKSYPSAYVSDIQILSVNKVTNIAITFCIATI